MRHLQIDRVRFEKEVKLAEGLRLRMYKCPTGHNTIGWGHNLDAKPISKRAAQVILEDDMADAERDLIQFFPWVLELDSVRQAALLDMSFNMGITTLLTFKNSMRFMAEKKFKRAAENFRLSRWYKQVGKRSEKLCQMIETGRYD